MNARIFVVCAVAVGTGFLWPTQAVCAGPDDQPESTSNKKGVSAATNKLNIVTQDVFSAEFLKRHGFAYSPFERRGEHIEQYVHNQIPLKEVERIFGFDRKEMKHFPVPGGMIGDTWLRIDIRGHSVIVYYIEEESSFKIIDPESIGPLLHRRGQEIVVRVYVCLGGWKEGWFLYDKGKGDVQPAKPKIEK
jgi:hypothetical protein